MGTVGYEIKNGNELREEVRLEKGLDKNKIYLVKVTKNSPLNREYLPVENRQTFSEFIKSETTVKAARIKEVFKDGSE